MTSTEAERRLMEGYSVRLPADEAESMFPNFPTQTVCQECRRETTVVEISLIPTTVERGRRNVRAVGRCGPCTTRLNAEADEHARHRQAVGELVDALNAEPRSRKGIRISRAEKVSIKKVEVSATMRRKGRTLTWNVAIDLTDYISNRTVRTAFDDQKWVGPVNSYFSDHHPNTPDDAPLMAECRERIRELLAKAGITVLDNAAGAAGDAAAPEAPERTPGPNTRNDGTAPGAPA